MARKKFILDPNAIYHVSARTHNKSWFTAPMDSVWQTMQDQLYFLKHAFNFQIYAFVLMSNHFHSLFSAPSANLSEGMQYFMSGVTRNLQNESGDINQLWGSRFYRTRLDSYWSIINSYKYIYRNPVRAGICNLVEEYKYSTLSGLLGKTHLLIPVTDDKILFSSDIQETIEWLNTPSSKEAEESVKSALKKSNYLLPKIKNKINPWTEEPI